MIFIFETLITSTWPRVAGNQKGAVKRCMETDRLCPHCCPFWHDAKLWNEGGLTMNLILHNIVT